jgi:hypothetical protein
MKNQITVLFLVLVSTGLLAQTTQVSVGYYAPFAIEPGAKAGVHLYLKDWATEKTKKDVELLKHNYLFINPQVGFFSRPRNHSSLLINGDVGVKRQKDGKKTYSAFSVGLGYLAKFSITSFTVNFSGEIIKKERERQDFFLPTINYEFGGSINQTIGWYTKCSYGIKLSSTIEKQPALFTEFGMKFNLGKTTKE